MNKHIYILIVLLVICKLCTISGFAQKALTADEVAKLDDYKHQADNYKEKGELSKSAQFINKIAFFYWEKGMIEKSTTFFLQSAELNIKIQDLNEAKTVFSNLGLIYAQRENFNESLKYFLKSLKLRRELGKKEDISAGLVDIAYILGLTESYEDAIKKLVEALDIATEINHSRLILTIYKMLAENYRKLGNIPKATEYANRYLDYQSFVEKKAIKQEFIQREQENLVEVEKARLEKLARELEFELINLEKDRAADSMNRKLLEQKTKLQLQDELSKKQQMEVEMLKAQDALKESKIKQQEAYRRNQRIITFAGLVVIFLGVLIAIILFRSNLRRKRDNKRLKENSFKIAAQKAMLEQKSKELEVALKKIEIQNKNITDSISYASRIQTAMLTEPSILVENVPDSFLFFLPRDVVSGDYYWFTEARKKFTAQQKKFLIAAVDCTGHGVPGALLSMIGSNMLEDIVNRRRISDPEFILDELHLSIRKALKQETTENRDGMDLALCAIDFEDGIVEFSGAKNPLIYFKNDEMFKIKGDAKPIGGIKLEKHDRKFTQHIIAIDQPTTFYIFSDGFGDQFGAKTNRKYMATKFYEFLKKIHKEPFHLQKELLLKEYLDWKGDTEQTDDILVIGFKVG